MSDAPLATTVTRDIADPIRSRAGGSMLAMRLRANSEYIAIPLLALAIAAGLFALFLTAIKSPVDFVSYVWRGGFGTAISFQNTLQRSAPLILTALAVAISGAHRLDHDWGRGRACARRFRVGRARDSHDWPGAADADACCHGALRDDRRAFWVGLSGFLRYARGVNETMSSLLLPYIGVPIMNFFVEGALRDSSNPNKPSTLPIGEAYMVGKIPKPKCTGDSHSASALASRSIS